MIHKTLTIAGVLIASVIMLTSDAKALPLLTTETSLIKLIKPKEEIKKQHAQLVHKVVKKDNLTSIAKKYKVTPQRIYDKNKHIKSPDVIRVGQKLVVPHKSEKLKKRAIYKPLQHIPSDMSQKTGNSDTLIGSIGYARCGGGQCVTEPGVNSPHLGPNTGPNDWAVLFTKPRIGATVLFTYQHTGVVTGIWSNGDVEIRHRNYCGNQTRFSPSEIRGYR